MSSGSILPTLGPAPPNIRRAPIPRELAPDLPDPSKNTRNGDAGQETEGRSGSGFQSQTFGGRSPNLAGGSAVSVQVAESRQSKPAADLPSSNPGARRIEQAVQQARDASQGENASGLTDEEEAYVQELRAIDREVRAHEAAHASTGGAFAGQPSYDYVTGPDGARYAVSGRVSIDTSAISGDPEATIRKLETVRRAALAPAQPSGQDRAVAAQAEVGLREARAEQNEERGQDTALPSDEGSGPADAATEESVLPSVQTATEGDTGNAGSLTRDPLSTFQAPFQAPSQESSGQQTRPVLDLFA